MRPQDIVILLKIAAKGSEKWYMKDLANELYISKSEISESLNRNVIAGFISNSKKRLFKAALLEFILHGIKYVYPQKPGNIQRGVLTAQSANPLSGKIQSQEKFIWPYALGNDRGFSISPLHPNVPKACLKDKKLYELLALVDAIRIGNAREYNLAVEELEKRL